MCKNCCSKDYKSPTTEVYLDKFVKYIFSPILFILGVIGLVILFLGKILSRTSFISFLLKDIQLKYFSLSQDQQIDDIGIMTFYFYVVLQVRSLNNYLFRSALLNFVVFYISVDRIKCYDYSSLASFARKEEAEEFCWIDFYEATNHSNVWVPENSLPHKLFPVLLIGESACVLLPIILWYWCYGRGITDDVNSIIDHVNCLTDAYFHYDRGRHLTVSENLHNHLDNYLQFLIYCLTARARSTFISFIVKWLCVIFVLCGWVIGHFLIHMGFKFEIFRDKFVCLFNTDISGVQSVAICTIPTSTYLRAVWFINMAVTIALIIATIGYVIDSCRSKLYEKSFLYNSVPGCMDRRLAMCVKKFFASQHVSLLAKFCEMNSHLLYDVGKSKTLSRKYALLEGISPGRESVVDRHYPVIQPYQLDEFVIQSELHFLNVQPKITKHGDSDNKLKETNDNKSDPKPKFFNKRKRKVKPKTSRRNGQLRYMPPHILNRTLHKFGSESPSSFRGQNESPITHRSNQTQLTLEDLEFKTSTPEKGTLSRQSFFLPSLESSRVQNKHFRPAYPSNVIQPSQPASTRTRELDPYAYRLYTSILRKKAENIAQWKP